MDRPIPTVRAIKSVTFSYVPKQDRILAAINPGSAGAWSCWLTRRIVQALIDRLPNFVESTSPTAKQAPSAVRGDVLAFERESAIASTAHAMSYTSSDVIEMSVTAAELVDRLSISARTDHFRVEIQGETGNGAIGAFGRAELQRFLQMLQAEVAKANWFGAAETNKAKNPNDANPKPVSH